MSTEAGETDWVQALERLSVHDVDARQAARTRERCLAAMAAHRPRRRRTSAAGVTGWLEPFATLGVGLLYLVAAIRASMVLLQIGSI